MVRIARSVVVALLILATAGMAGIAQTAAESKTAKPAAKSSKSTAAKKAAKTAKAAPAKTLAAATQKTSAASAASQPTQDVIILKGAPMGGVKFLHFAHSKDRGIKCETCHHPAKAESPVAASEQHCTACHTPVAKAPMKTKRQAAFHDAAAKSGICIDCHKAENAKGKKAPTKCLECHQKANA